MAASAEDIYNRMLGIKPVTRNLAATDRVPSRVISNNNNNNDYNKNSVDITTTEYRHHGNNDNQSDDGTEEAMEESRGPLEESGATHDDSGSDQEVENHVVDDIARFEQSFKNITQRYRLINRIGEGEFCLSSVVSSNLRYSSFN